MTPSSQFLLSVGCSLESTWSHWKGSHPIETNAYCAPWVQYLASPCSICMDHSIPGKPFIVYFRILAPETGSLFRLKNRFLCRFVASLHRSTVLQRFKNKLQVFNPNDVVSNCKNNTEIRNFFARIKVFSHSSWVMRPYQKESKICMQRSYLSNQNP